MPIDDRGLIGGLLDALIGPPFEVRQQRLLEQQQQQQRSRQAGDLKSSLQPFGAETAGQIGGLLTSGIPQAQALGAQQLQELQQRRAEGVSFADTRAAAEQQSRATRIETQQQRLGFLQDTIAKQLGIDQARFDLGQSRIEAAQPRFGADEALAAGELKQQHDAITRAIAFREQAGAIGPIDLLQHPEVAAMTEFFTRTTGVQLIRDLTGDQRLSNEDRKEYASLLELGMVDWLFSGSRSTVAKMRLLEQGIATRQLVLATQFPGLTQTYPQFFERLNFDPPEGSELVQPGAGPVQQSIGQGLRFGLPVGGQF